MFSLTYLNLSDKIYVHTSRLFFKFEEKKNYDVFSSYTMFTGQKTAYEAATAKLENMMKDIADKLNGRFEFIPRTVPSRLETSCF